MPAQMPQSWLGSLLAWLQAQCITPTLRIAPSPTLVQFHCWGKRLSLQVLFSSSHTKTDPWKHVATRSTAQKAGREESENQFGWKRSLRSSPTCDPRPPRPFRPWHWVQVQSFLKHFQGLHHLPGEPIPVPNHLSVKKFLPASNLNLPWCNLRLWPLVLSLPSRKQHLIHPYGHRHLNILSCSSAG